MSGWSRYGYYRYGHSEYRPIDRAVSRRDRDTGPTLEELFGAGIALRTSDDDEGVPWDFVADSSGDLAATTGGDELRKDMAFATARDASGLIGTLSQPNDLARLETDIQEIGRRDSRVDGVAATVSRSRTDPNLIDARIQVGADTQDLPEMVFPLGE